MNIKQNTLPLEIISDVVVIFGFVVALFIYSQYSHEISEELNLITTSIVEDLNNSLASTSSKK